MGRGVLGSGWRISWVKSAGLSEANFDGNIASLGDQDQRRNHHGPGRQYGC